MSDRKVIEYNLISNHDLEKLVKYINLDLIKGWQPLGAPFSDGTYNELDRDECCIHQAMVKYEQRIK